MAEIPVKRTSGGIPWWVWALLALLVIGLLFWLFSDNDDVDRVDRSAVAPVEQTVAPTEQATVAGAATPQNVESAAEANRMALQRLNNDPNATPRIYFPLGSAEVTSEAQAVLDRMIDTRADARTSGITLVGFADRSGPRPLNQELSGQRAEAVRQYLAGKGIGADRIDVEADGEQPTQVQTGANEAEPLNRRVRVELSDPE